MLINQGDVYEVNFPFPDGQYTPHMVIVLSIPKVYGVEKTFIGVPISDSEKWNHDEYSFPLHDSDFDKGFKTESYARMHLITVLSERDLVSGRRIKIMTPQAFDELLAQIQELVFGLLPPEE